MDVQTIASIVGAVLVITVLLYIYDRRSKHQLVDVFDAAKLGVGAAAIAGGVSYAVGGEAIADAVQTVAATTEVAQEMFTGKPEF
jgi:prolipoprotein diacylglyceryltransferase